MKSILAFLTAFLTMALSFPVLANPGYSELENKCMAIAREYADEHGGQPWSPDARFGYVNKYICTVVVTQEAYDGRPCTNSYVISLKTWKVTDISPDDCIDQN
jgi:hypothetical protein